MPNPFAVNTIGQEPWELRGANDARLRSADTRLNALETADVSLDTRLDALEADSGWVTPTLLNSWVSYDTTYGPPGYRRKNGVVYLKGLVKNGTLSTAIFILPVGFRPGTFGNTPIRLFVVQANDLVNRVDIDGTTGGVVAAPGNATWTSLNGITFIAET